MVAEAPDPVPGHLLRRLVARRRARSRPSTPTSTSPGASRRTRCAEKIDVDPRAGRRAGPHAAVRHPAPRDHPGHRARRPGREAERLLDGLDPADDRRRRRQLLGASESVGQQRMRALHAAYRRGGSARDLEIYPNLWAGVGLVRGGAGTALVGSHEEVADRIEEYAALGIDEFILSGYPHLEEAYWFGEGVLPKVAAPALVTTAVIAPARGRSPRYPASRC